MDPALCRAVLSPALPSNAELRHRSQEESDSLIHICGCHIQMLQEWLHGILRANRTYVAIGSEYPSATAIIPHGGQDEGYLVDVLGVLQAFDHESNVARRALDLKKVHARMAVLEAAMGVRCNLDQF